MTIGAREALDRLRAALDAGELDPDLEALHVDLMSAFGSVARRHSDANSEPADLDIGVRFDGPVRLLEVVNLLVDTTGYDNIDVAVVTGEHPVLDTFAIPKRCYLQAIIQVQQLQYFPDICNKCQKYK